MIYKLVSSRRVIAKLIADLDIKEDDLRISDIREWISEAIEKIGAVTQFVKKVSGVDCEPVLRITGHQAKLPCDLHMLHQVAYSPNINGPWAPMRKATGTFSVWGCDSNKSDCTPDKIIQDDILINLAVNLFGNINKTEALELINTNQNTRTILTNLINLHNNGSVGSGQQTSVNPSTVLQYSLKPSYIMTNVPTGYLKLSYSAIPVDEDNYPLIPDLTSYSEAIYWYITMKLKYPEYLNGRMNREIYYDIRNSWNFYSKQAYAEALMPNEDGMEAVKNTWLKIIPDMNEHSSFYSHTGTQSIKYLH